MFKRRQRGGEGLTKFTRKFNGEYSRFAFWQALTAKLAEFDSLVRHKEHLTPEDVRAQREIHKALYDCYSISKGMREQHRDTLRRVITHASEVTN